MLGERPWLVGGQLADGPAQSYGRWKQFLATPPTSQKAILASQHGGKKMAAEINWGLTAFKESGLPEAVILTQGGFELPRMEEAERRVIGTNPDRKQKLGSS